MGAADLRSSYSAMQLLRGQSLLGEPEGGSTRRGSGGGAEAPTRLNQTAGHGVRPILSSRSESLDHCLADIARITERTSAARARIGAAATASAATSIDVVRAGARAGIPRLALGEQYGYDVGTRQVMSPEPTAGNAGLAQIAARDVTCNVQRCDIYRRPPTVLTIGIHDLATWQRRENIGARARPRSEIEIGRDIALILSVNLATTIVNRARGALPERRPPRQQNQARQNRSPSQHGRFLCFQDVD